MGVETISDIVADMRRGFNQSWHDIDREWAHDLADRIEAAAMREREAAIEDADNDTPIVMSCDTCAHYDRKRQYCPVQDLTVARCCAGLRPTFADGPCCRWECRYTKKKER